MGRGRRSRRRGWFVVSYVVFSGPRVSQSGNSHNARVMTDSEYGLHLRRVFPETSTVRLATRREILDCIRAETYEPDLQVAASRQRRSHQAVHDDKVGIDLLDDVDK